MALNAAAYAEDPYAQLFGPSSTESALAQLSTTHTAAPGLLLRERKRTDDLIARYLEALGQTNASRERVAGADLGQMERADQRKFLSDTQDKTADWNAAMQFALPGMEYDQQMQQTLDALGIGQASADIFGTHAKGVSDLAAGGQALPGGVNTPWGDTVFGPQLFMTPDQLDTSDGGSAADKSDYSFTFTPTGDPQLKVTGQEAANIFTNPEARAVFMQRALEGGFRLPSSANDFNTEDTLQGDDSVPFGGMGGGGGIDQLWGPNESAADPNAFTPGQLSSYRAMQVQSSSRGKLIERKKYGTYMIVTVTEPNGHPISRVVLDEDGQPVDGD